MIKFTKKKNELKDLYHYKMKGQRFLDLSVAYKNKMADEHNKIFQLAKDNGADGILKTPEKFEGFIFTNRLRVNGFTKQKLDKIVYFVPKDEELKAKVCKPREYTLSKKHEEIFGTSLMGGNLVAYAGNTIGIQSIDAINKPDMKPIKHKEFEKLVKLAQKQGA